MVAPRARLRWWWYLLAVWAASCGPCGFQPEPGVKVVVPAMPTTLDWSHSDPDSWANYPVMLATQRGLTQLGPDHAVEPGLAERWERVTDGQGRDVYTFHLRRDVRWSNGAPLVARDFVVGWRRALQGRERGEMADLEGASEALALQEQGAPEAEVRAALERVGVEAMDAHTLRVTLARPRSYFLARVANVYLFYPAPSADLEGKSDEEVRDYFDRPRDGRPLALGPYRVERWDRAGERVRLVHNPASAFPAPMAEGETPVPVITLMKSEIGPALYERERVDFVFVDSAAALRIHRPDDLRREPLLSTYFLAFNTEKAPLDRPEVRRALSRALDREALLAGLLPAARPSHVLLPPELPGAATTEQAARLPHDAPEQARAELAGVAGLERPLRLVYRSGDGFVPEVAIAERVAAQFARVGVRVVLEARSDFSAEISRRSARGPRTYDLYLRRLGADYAHPNTFFTLFEREGNHQTGWETQSGGEPMARFERLLEAGDGAPDEASAHASYVQAQEVLVGEQAVIAPLYHPDRYYRARERLRGLDVDPFNFLALRALRLGPTLDTSRAGESP
ncbi:peptide ABC transporter substrate-binding protein [Myxococcus xanthus]|uniref:peptide ABC transporter substrate-binding protein n=1 Tax=Myxococcus xanthus TaxID=34 RepID=UPI0011285D44|nr:peptide ABC transporter substrate-binding protein [Myxococcus xanthus]QDE81782.1 peptide ABC transporter substrate-binding protein [Myxococcus xanthus]QDE96082.1 peptide ABC transporter substrate-binding protein [Myxococcus xanthus]